VELTANTVAKWITFASDSAPVRRTPERVLALGRLVGRSLSRNVHDRNRHDRGAAGVLDTVGVVRCHEPCTA
jgi:hypothetical protein